MGPRDVRFGVVSRNAAAGGKTVEAAGQLAGSQRDAARDRSWVGRRMAAIIYNGLVDAVRGTLPVALYRLQ